MIVYRVAECKHNIAGICDQKQITIGASGKCWSRHDRKNY